MQFCQIWIARRATRSNLANPQTFPLEKPRGSYSGLRFALVFWMSLYKAYIQRVTTTLNSTGNIRRMQFKLKEPEMIKK